MRLPPRRRAAQASSCCRSGFEYPSERMLAGPTDFSGREAGGRAACRASAGPVPPRRVPAADAFTFTVALALLAFCIVPVLWLPRTKAPTEEAKTPALI